MFLGRDGFQFTAEARKKLGKCLDTAGYNAKTAIPEIESSVEVFLVVRESPLPGRDTFERIAALARALERTQETLQRIDDPGRDLMLAALLRTGATTDCLEQALGSYARALELVRRDRPRMARSGRRPETNRAALVAELRTILERHHRPSRLKVLEILARQGLEGNGGETEALLDIVRVIFRAIREPVPIDLAKVTRRAGGKNPVRSA